MITKCVITWPDGASVTATIDTICESMYGLPHWNGATERLEDFGKKKFMPSHGMVMYCRNCARETHGTVEVSQEGYWDSPW